MRSISSTNMLSRLNKTTKEIIKNKQMIGSGIVLALSISYNRTYCSAEMLVPQPVRTKERAILVLPKKQKEIIAPTNTVQNIVKKAKKIVKYLKRILMYAILGVPAAIIAPSAYLLRDIIPLAEQWSWDYSIWAIEKLGPTFIKLAQWASTRPDIFPPGLIDRLSKLQDNVTVNYSMGVVENTLTEAFGVGWKNRLSLDSKPIGAGCVAQVFKGNLKTEGKPDTPVAIKLIHPHVDSTVETDMELLNSFANFVERFPRLEILSLGDVLREFGSMMSAQTDLRLEASNLKKFGAKFIDDTWAVFPKPIDGFIKKNVIVETLMQGTPIINYMKLKCKSGDDVDKLKMKLSDLGTRAVLKMIFFDNFVHGDLHPGNMLVQFDEKTGEPKLVFLDCGIVYSTKSEKDHQALVDVCISFMRHDGYSAGKHMIDNTKSTAINNADDFCKSIQKIVDDSADEKYFEHIGDYVIRVCDLARNHMVRLDPAYFHIAMTLKVVEGVSLSLNRDLDLVSKCIPIILKSQALRALGITKFPTELEDNEDIEDIKEKHNVKKITKRKNLSS